MGMCCGSYVMMNIIQAGTTTIFNVCDMTGYSIQQGNGILRPPNHHSKKIKISENVSNSKMFAPSSLGSAPTT